MYDVETRKKGLPDHVAPGPEGFWETLIFGVGVIIFYAYVAAIFVGAGYVWFHYILGVKFR